uniref:Uncharacterized protein n=1 Tax=Plectus sambesii TaxID=2011161 RepID=A0A914UT18_9BILA
MNTRRLKRKRPAGESTTGTISARSPYDRSAPDAPGCRRLNSFFIGKPLHQSARDDDVSTDARPLVGVRPINALAAGNLAPHSKYRAAGRWSEKPIVYEKERRQERASYFHSARLRRRRGEAAHTNRTRQAQPRSSLGGRTLARVKKKWRVGRTAGCYGVCEAAAARCPAAAAPPQPSFRLAQPSLAATYRRRPPTPNRRVDAGRRLSIVRPIGVSTGAPVDVTPARFEAAGREPADGCLQRHLSGASCPPTHPSTNSATPSTCQPPRSVVLDQPIAAQSPF